MIGKWHLGFYNWESTPINRGFDTFYGFFNGAEDHYTHVISHFLDFRDNKEIVRDLNGTYSVNTFTKVSNELEELNAGLCNKMGYVWYPYVLNGWGMTKYRFVLVL